MRARFIYVAAALLFIAASGEVWAQSNNNTFHKAGSLQCTACHSIHYSEEGADPTNGVNGPNASLLFKDNITDACLACHDTAGSDATFDDGSGSTPPKVAGTITNELPGGSFTSTMTTAGNGHSLAGSGFAAANLATAPGSTGGGAFSSTDFHCTACHDPHGDTSTSFTFRNLNKTVNGVVFTATEIGSVDANEAELRSDGGAADQNSAINATNHNVYKGEMGAWCGACHSNTDDAGTGFHGTANTDSDVGDGTDWIRHPTGTALPSAYDTNYGANSDFNYPIVTTAAGASTTAEWAIAAGESQVFCLSCHNAHGSTYANATKWDTSAATASNAGCGKCHGR